MRDLKWFIKSLVYREHFAKLEKISKMSEASGKNFEAISKPTSSRIELKSNNSLESLKRSMRSPTMKSSRDSVKDNDVKMNKG